MRALGAFPRVSSTRPYRPGTGLNIVVLKPSGAGVHACGGPPGPPPESVFTLRVARPYEVQTRLTALTARKQPVNERVGSLPSNAKDFNSHRMGPSACRPNERRKQRKSTVETARGLWIK